MYKSIKALLVSFLLTGAACGGAGPEGKDLARFTGIWTPTAGTVTLSCGGQPNPTPISGTVTWSTGTSSDLIQTLSTSSCVLHADVEGDTATGVDNQPCTVQGTGNYGDLITQTTTITAYTFALASDGRTATENTSGTLTQTDNTIGTVTSCTLTETAGSYQKQ